MPTWKLDDPLKARALQALRLKAGFATAAAAAEKHGWSVSSYKSHESGTRVILDRHAEVYGPAYGVKPRQIMHPDLRQVERWRDGAESEIRARRAEVAERLTCARILAGYATPAAAAREARVAFSTYQKHERGQNSIVPGALELYAEVFGVRTRWLASGDMPSGLGLRIDSQVMDVMKNPESFAALRSTHYRPREEKIRRLRSAFGPGRPGISSVSIFEYDWHAIETSGGHLEDLNHRVWTLPLSFFADQAMDHRNLIVVAVTRSQPGVIRGERIFVSRNFAGQASAGYLTFDRARLALRRSQAGVNLGAVVWRLQPPAKSQVRSQFAGASRHS